MRAEAAPTARSMVLAAGQTPRAMTLVELERGAEALEHLNWCYHRDPGHLWLPKLMDRARKQELAFPESQDATLSQL